MNIGFIIILRNINSNLRITVFIAQNPIIDQMILQPFYMYIFMNILCIFNIVFVHHKKDNFNKYYGNIFLSLIKY